MKVLSSVLILISFITFNGMKEVRADNDSFGALDPCLSIVKANLRDRLEFVGWVVNGGEVPLSRIESGPISIMIPVLRCCMRKVVITYDGKTRIEHKSPYSLGGNNGSWFKAVPSLSFPGTKTIGIVGYPKKSNRVGIINVTFTVVDT
jgi:hypothetical protein